MFDTIHKKLILRLAVAWFILSVVAGAVSYFVEHKKIDDFVIGLAEIESRKFIADEMTYLDDLTPENVAILRQKSQEHLLTGRFSVIEFYDKSKKQVIELAREDTEKIEDRMNLLKHDRLMNEIIQYENFYIDDQMFVRVLSPLKTTDGRIVGYFEGAYRVEPRIVKDIRERVLFSLIQVVMTVLISTVVLYPVIIALNKGLIKYSVDLSSANLGMLEVLGSAIAKRDSDTNDHNYRVTIYAVRLAEAMHLKRKEIQALIKGAFLHDAGKIAISDNILLKPGKLTEAEHDIMKTHVEHGAEIIGSYVWLQDAEEVVRYHHEKFSGDGYKDGLKGSAIPVAAKIFAVVDVFDALTSKRPYKEPLSFEDSMRLIREERGKHFDPVILDVFSDIAWSIYSETHKVEGAYMRATVQELISRYFGSDILVKI